MNQPEIQKYWEKFIEEAELPADTPYGRIQFGNTVEMSNELAMKVVKGQKTATSSLQKMYERENRHKSSVGDYHIIMNGNHQPQTIVTTTKIAVVPFEKITEEFAVQEGDGSLENWKRIHEAYYGNLLQSYGETLKQNTLLYCEWFEIVAANIK